MLTFFVREDQNPNGTKLRDIRSKHSNIRKQNQNWPNLKCIQCISVKKKKKSIVFIYIFLSLGVWDNQWDTNWTVGMVVNIPYWWPFQFAHGNEIFWYWLIPVHCFRILTLRGDGRRRGYLPLTLFFSFSFLGFFLHRPMRFPLMEVLTRVLIG